MTATGEPPLSDDCGPTPTAAKNELRRRLSAARRAASPQQRAEWAAALAVATGQLAAQTGGPVCAYLPIGSEPGSVAGLDALRAAGHEVLLPVVPKVAGPLEWARYEGPGSLTEGPLGLREPTTDRQGVTAITKARLVLVPALAVDRRGVRLGRGGGYYDRTLPLARADVVVAAMLHDDELVDELPTEPHDVRVSAVVRPATGVTLLGRDG
ncbi:5-formyltetrahydrofolate cyclo-ligase [Pseudonocardia hispaniensis]|uniref:5-formyltetrahydrofolate cyclo-ligase n=1 Tax=Pseudonocardia hispaniensis TaxID=904933 RepID=A0ABW1J0K5_9PSEU